MFFLFYSRESFYSIAILPKFQTLLEQKLDDTGFLSLYYPSSKIRIKKTWAPILNKKQLNFVNNFVVEIGV